MGVLLSGLCTQGEPDRSTSRPGAVMIQVSTADKAYCAAIVDTLANLRTRTTDKSVLPEVQVNCPNLDLLRWLGAITGTGHFETRRDYMRHVCTDHCPEAHAHVQSTSGRWSVTGARATVLLVGVSPYLRLRTAEASELIQVGLAAGWKPATVTKMAALGWTVPERPALRAV